MRPHADHVRVLDHIWDLVATNDLTRPLSSMPDYCEGCVVERGSTRFAAITTPYAAYRRQHGDSLMAVYRCTYGHTWPCFWPPTQRD